ncbi:MAG: MmgE/PrpD family protein [Gammaproteobacteria bacterium]|nr:MmgE/PrpD family protein [Gammaproteobacteria bacterium]
MAAELFAKYAAQVARDTLPSSAQHAARRCLIDWFSATLPGGARPPATLLVEALADELDLGNASLYPSGRRATVRAAALINGTAAHAVEFDDIYRDGLYHPGAPVIAAALAVAQAEHASGETLLKAIVAGYEVSNRIAEAVNPAHYRYWHTTGTVGTLGAAAAAGAVLGLHSDRMAHAIGTATTMAAGLQQAFRSDAMSKPLHAGRAAESGVLAALAARRGVTAAAHMLDGELGFGAAMSESPDWRAATDDLGEYYTIAFTTQKNHGCCGHTFAALDAIIALRNAHELKPSSIRRIRVGTYAAALEVTGNRHPLTVYEARFSLPYCAAVALRDGRVRLDAFDAEHLSDHGLRELMDRVELYLDEEAEKRFPRRRSAQVEIETNDGEVLAHHATTRKGDPDDPLTDDELEDKFLELSVPVLGEGGSRALLEALSHVEDIGDMRELRNTQTLRATAAMR